MKSQSIAHLLSSNSEHIYIGLWILKSRCTQHEFYGLGDLQECTYNVFFFFFEIRRGGQPLFFGQVRIDLFFPRAAQGLWVRTQGSPSKKLVGSAVASGLASRGHRLGHGPRPFVRTSSLTYFQPLIILIVGE